MRLRITYAISFTAIFIAIAGIVVGMQLRSVHRHGDTLLPGLHPGPSSSPSALAVAPRAGDVLDGHTIIGTLSVPAAKISELPIVHGTDQGTLDTGMAGAYSWSGPGETGVFALAAHRVGAGGPFLNLNHVKIGDAIWVKDSATTYHYRVTTIQVVKSDDTNVLTGSNSKSEIALITCTPIGTYSDRLVVKGSLAQ